MAVNIGINRRVIDLNKIALGTAGKFIWWIVVDRCLFFVLQNSVFRIRRTNNIDFYRLREIVFGSSRRILRVTALFDSRNESDGAIKGTSHGLHILGITEF